MTILRTTELPPFGNQICIYWAAGGPPQCARLIRWHCWGSIHALARSTKLLECGEDRPHPLQLICNSTQDRSQHKSSRTDALSASSPSHKDELNMRQNSNAHRAKQIKHHTNQHEKRRPYLLSMQSFEMCVAAFEILLPAVPKRSIAMTITLSLKHYEMHRGASSWI